jgi:hypothetical protein
MRLDEAIITYLDAASLTRLASSLGLEWWNLPGDAAGRAAALATAAGRQGRSADLLAGLRAAYPGVAWADLPTPLPTLRALHADLCRRHSLDSLRTICFRLGVDFDDLSSDSKAGRARELVLWMEREGRVAELWPAPQARPARGRAVSSLVKRRAYTALLGLPGRTTRRATWLLLLPAAIMATMITADVPLEKEERHQATVDSPAIVAQAIATAPAAATVLASPAAEGSPAAQPTTGTASPTVLPASATPAMLIVGPLGANLRQGPGSAYAVVATLRAGARLEVRAVSLTGEWYQVRLPGKGSPWIDATYVLIESGLGGIPVATAARPTTVAYAATPTAGYTPSGYGPPAPIRPTVIPTTLPTRTPAAPPTPLPSPTAPPP